MSDGECVKKCKDHLYEVKYLIVNLSEEPAILKSPGLLLHMHGTFVASSFHLDFH